MTEAASGGLALAPKVVRNQKLLEKFKTKNNQRTTSPRACGSLLHSATFFLLKPKDNIVLWFILCYNFINR